MEADARSEAAAESLDLFLFDIADMAQAIARTKAEIAAIRPAPARPGEIEDATGELDSIVQTTESAASRILAAAERMQEIAWTLRERGIDTNFCDQLDAEVTEIYTACSFQDLTGQRTRKVIHVLRYLEHRVAAMIEIWGKDALAPPERKAASGEIPMNGPSPGGLDQSDVDRMMQLGRPAPEDPLAALKAEPPAAPAEEPRQDATLEDIERVMMALDPMVALREEMTGQDSSGSQHLVKAPPESFEECRPELSVSAAIQNESADATPGETDTAAMPKALVEEAADAAEATLDLQWGIADELATQRAEVEVEMSTWVTATPLPVQADAAKPLAEPPWLALERLALNFLSQPSMAKAPASQPSEAEAATPLASSNPALPPAELNFPAEHAPDATAANGEPEPNYPPVFETDLDDFLFEPDLPAREPAQPPPATQWRSTVTPASPSAPRPANDPLAPLRALSDEEKIALFS